MTEINTCSEIPIIRVNTVYMLVTAYEARYWSKEFHMVLMLCYQQAWVTSPRVTLSCFSSLFAQPSSLTTCISIRGAQCGQLPPEVHLPQAGSVPIITQPKFLHPTCFQVHAITELLIIYNGLGAWLFGWLLIHLEIPNGQGC